MAWFKNWFGSPYYPLLYKHRSEAEAERFMELLLENIQLKPGAKVLDLACGRGRHASFLAGKGLKVFGWDISPESIAEASQKYPLPDLHFEVRDMREAFTEKGFDAVFNLFTSFGYFDDQSENQQVLCNIAEALNPQAYLVLDYLNPLVVAKRLVAYEEQNVQHIRFTIERKIQEGFIYKHIQVNDAETQNLYTEKVQFLNYEHFTSLFENAKLKIIDCWGDYRGREFEAENSERMIFICQKN